MDFAENHGVLLTEKEAHCIARLLQGPMCGTEGHDGILEGCGFCKFKCWTIKDENHLNGFSRLDSIRQKLEEITGVDLSSKRYGTLWPNGFPYKKFLKNSNDDVKEFCRNFFADI